MALRIEFTANVNKAGYEWREGPPRDGTPKSWKSDFYLYAREPLETEERRPFADDPALFRNMAAMQCTKDRIAGFVGEHGNLHAQIQPVSLSDWDEFLWSLRSLVTIWDCVHERDTTGLANYFTVTPDGRVQNPDTYDGHPVRAEYAWSNWKLDRNVVDGELITVAHDYVLRAINSVLMLQPLSLEESHAAYGFYMYPPHLSEAVWYQFALAIIEGAEYHRCFSCDKVFERGPNANRKSRLYCSDSCRVKAHRVRVNQAREMRKNGKSLRQIAAEFQTDMQTVKRWVNDKGK